MKVNACKNSFCRKGFKNGEFKSKRTSERTCRGFLHNWSPYHCHQARIPQKLSFQYHLFDSKYKSRLNRLLFLVNKPLREYDWSEEIRKQKIRVYKMLLKQVGVKCPVKILQFLNWYSVLEHFEPFHIQSHYSVRTVLKSFRSSQNQFLINRSPFRNFFKVFFKVFFNQSLNGFKKWDTSIYLVWTLI